MGQLQKKFNCFTDMSEYSQDADNLWYETEEVADFEQVMYWVSDRDYISLSENTNEIGKALNMFATAMFPKQN